MCSERVETTLGDVLTRVKRPVSVSRGTIYPAVSVTKDGQGLGLKEPFVGGVTNYSKLFRIQSGDVVVRTITAFESPAGVAHAEHDGHFVSAVFLTYEVHDGALPEYLGLFFQSPGFWWEMRNRAQGTVLRRKTISHEAFCGIPITLPSLSEQRRIVDLMAHLDRHLGRLKAEAAAMTDLWEQLLTLPIEGARRVRLGELLGRIDAGKSPSGVERPPQEGERAVLKVSAIGRNTFLPEQVKTVGPSVSLPEDTRLHADDVLMVRANGVLERVGQVCRVPRDFDRLFLCDKTLRLVPKPMLSPKYLTCALLAPDARRQIRELTGGSDMRNISQAAIRQIEIPVPPLEAQALLAEQVSSATECAETLVAEAGLLATLRSQLLVGLLSASVTVPSDYDKLVTGVA